MDDCSRYLLLCEQFGHEPTTEELTGLLGRLPRKPEKILMDNRVKTMFAHPYYPQDKVKVERTIRNVVGEFLNLLRKFPEWLANIGEYRR